MRGVVTAVPIPAVRGSDGTGPWAAVHPAREGVCRFCCWDNINGTRFQA